MRKSAEARRDERSLVEISTGPKAIAEAPLTAEERDLLRIARKADPKDLATLDPAVRAKQDADDVAQFESFFYQPPVKVTDQIEAQ